MVAGREALGVMRLRSAGGSPVLRNRREGSIVVLCDGGGGSGSLY